MGQPIPPKRLTTCPFPLDTHQVPIFETLPSPVIAPHNLRGYPCPGSYVHVPVADDQRRMLGERLGEWPWNEPRWQHVGRVDEPRAEPRRDESGSLGKGVVAGSDAFPERGKEPTRPVSMDVGGHSMGGQRMSDVTNVGNLKAAIAAAVQQATEAQVSCAQAAERVSEAYAALIVAEQQAEHAYTMARTAMQGTGDEGIVAPFKFATEAIVPAPVRLQLDELSRAVQQLGAGVESLQTYAAPL